MRRRSDVVETQVTRDHQHLIGRDAGAPTLYLSGPKTGAARASGAPAAKSNGHSIQRGGRCRCSPLIYVCVGVATGAAPEVKGEMQWL